MAAALRTDYQTARLLARIISGIGWVVVAIGVLALIAAVIAAITMRGGDAMGGVTPASYMGTMGLVGGVSLIVSGIVQIAVGQLLRATVDTADNTREMLAIMRS